MEFSIEARTARLSVGELADFQIGPRENGDGPQGIWRAQLGTHWHQELRGQLGAQDPHARFEIPIAADVMHRGWKISLTGRIDQLQPPRSVSGEALRDRPAAKLREIKSVLRPLPAAEEELRAEYPSYFSQLATYLALARLDPTLTQDWPAGTAVHGELVFVEAGSGLTQTIPVTAAEERDFTVQLERLTEFLDLRLRARERLRALRFRPAFAELRPGQESVQADLRSALERHRIVLFEAPTGFGKTGALLEAALYELQQGRYERLLYLTSKSTGQLQVAHQLHAMTHARGEDASGAGVMAWHVRNKREHCVNTTFHCTRETCQYLHDIERRWERSGLSRFYLFENEARSLETLREAGAQSLVCPYEITRTALAFHDVWIGDYNYVFSPSSRGLFFNQPGFEPSRSLLIIDEAHNLPTRVADAYSKNFSAGDAVLAGEQLHRVRAYAPLSNAWDHWNHFLQQLKANEGLNAGDEDDARDLLQAIAKHLNSVPLDYAELGPQASELLWQVPNFLSELEIELPRLWWCPRAGELVVTCLDAAPVIGETLRSFGAAVLATATLGPESVFNAACGLAAPTPDVRRADSPLRLGELNRRDTRALFKQLSTGAGLLEAADARHAHTPLRVHAATPWREKAYDVAVDLRVDTSYQKRQRCYATTAATIDSFCASQAQCGADAPMSPDVSRAIAVFFPSYSYAEAIQRELTERGSVIRVALQPRLPDLAAQRAWAEEALVLADALFLVLGSSFAEGVDFLGGRIAAAMVVGPALPEVNAVQRARMDAIAGAGKESAFRRVYQVPGIQKVNQALGRLVRAPGQHARILLHCRRFADPTYASLLAPEYQFGREIANDADLGAWLGEPTR